jgi:hypothetical protein
MKTFDNAILVFYWNLGARRIFGLKSEEYDLVTDNMIVE